MKGCKSKKCIHYDDLISDRNNPPDPCCNCRRNADDNFTQKKPREGINETTNR